jgi:hypothetical protein
MGISRRFLKKSSISILLISAALTLLPVQAKPQAPTEYQVKAAFIYNFAKFVEWPEEAFKEDRPFVIGILGEDPFGNLIDEAVAGKSVRDRKIAVIRYSKVEDAFDSHILFVSSSERENVARILKGLGSAPVLTVSDIGRFAEKGGMVELLMDQNRVRFAVNVAVVDRAGLKPSSQMLKLARIISGPAPRSEQGAIGAFFLAFSRMGFHIESWGDFDSSL